MTKADKTLCAIYGVLSATALVATWSQNILFFSEAGTTNVLAFIEACFANRAAASITIDMALAGPPRQQPAQNLSPA